MNALIIDLPQRKRCHPKHRCRRRVQRDDAGFAPLTMLLGLGLLVLPVLLLVLTLPTWEQRSVDAKDMAAQAARALATADTWTDGITAAQDTVSQETNNDGLDPADVTAAYSGSLTPGAKVTATVTVTIPAGVIPGVGTFGTVHYSAASTELVDLYRSTPG